jgi:hypothetical protein
VGFSVLEIYWQKFLANNKVYMDRISLYHVKQKPHIPRSSFLPGSADCPPAGRQALVVVPPLLTLQHQRRHFETRLIFNQLCINQKHRSLKKATG